MVSQQECTRFSSSPAISASVSMAPGLSTLSTNLTDGNRDNSLAIRLDKSNLTVNGHTLLLDVPDHVSLDDALFCTENSSSSSGAFISFHAAVNCHRHVLSMGKLRNIRFMSIFRFKVWWTTHWVGLNGREIERETQFLMLENSDTGRPYVLILPLVEGSFRASLQPGHEDNVDVCIESGSTKVLSSAFKSIVYVHAGYDPYWLVKDAMKVVRDHLGTFRLVEEKSLPGIIDKFGWCTWDAFYLTVHPQGVLDGVQNLVDGGCPPGLVLLDDGWQSISHDDDDISEEGMNRTSAGEQMPCRLVKFEENYKFRDYETECGKGMGAFVKAMKTKYPTVDYVYVWHALCGYWGGVRPGVADMPEAMVIKPKLSPGLETTMEDLAVDKIVNNGVGLVSPAVVDKLYEGLHSHLAAAGIDGVKVDVIHLLELVCEDYGGRVELAKTYFKALTSSVRKHFHGNGVIASMEHCNDFMLLGTEAVTLGRVGDDFWCTDPYGDPNGTFWLQGCHMVHCAYNSLWMGNFIHPDWDMFQSTHPCAEFHAASRAISGGPIYVSDNVGKHNFPLLRRVVLPDGSILRCECYALPTRDCLFRDPLHDGKTMLKIWNLNKFTGVIGAFNCQGGGWCREKRRNQCASEFSKTVSSKTNPMDIEWNVSKSPIFIKDAQLFAMYRSREKTLVLSEPTENINLSLEPFGYELVTVSPVVCLAGVPVQFAPIGLVNMLNAGGALRSLDYEQSLVRVSVKGAGEMRVYASAKPVSCKVNGRDVLFTYEEASMVAVDLEWVPPSGVSVVEYLFEQA